MKIFFQLLLVSTLFILPIGCGEENNDSDYQPAGVSDPAAVSDYDFFQTNKPHVIFRESPKFGFKPGKLKSLLENSTNAFGKKFPILLVFIDGLRKDIFDRESAAFKRHVKPADGWITFDEARSASTITHYSTFSIYHGILSFARDFLLRFSWGNGSPYLDLLRRDGFAIRDYGSPWQQCPNKDRIQNANEAETKFSSGGNVQVVFGKNDLDFCFKGNPELPLANPGLPESVVKDGHGNFVRSTDEASNLKLAFKKMPIYDKETDFYHQAYLDYYVLNKFLSDLKSKTVEDKSFTQLYLFSTHMGFSWPEYGLPDNDWKTFTGAEKFNKYKPYFPFSPNEKLYLDSSHTTREKFENSYANSVYYASFLLEKLIAGLKASKKYDDYMIVIVSDHGEKIYEGDLNLRTWKKSTREGSTHCCLPTKANTDIPLLIKFPKSFVGTGAIKERYPLGRHYDIFPTIFDALDFSNKKVFAEQHLTSGTSYLNNTDPPKCNISVSPRGDFGPIVFAIFSEGKNYYFSLDTHRPLDALGLFFLRVVDETTEHVIDEFKIGDRKARLEPYLTKKELVPCFESLFGKDYMDKVWYGERDEF